MEENIDPSNNKITEVIKHQHQFIVVSPWYDRQTRNSNTLNHFVSLLEETVSWVEFTGGIVRDAGDNMYIMTFFGKMKCYIVPAKSFREEVLADKEYMFLVVFH